MRCIGRGGVKWELEIFFSGSSMKKAFLLPLDKTRGDPSRNGTREGCSK